MSVKPISESSVWETHTSHAEWTMSDRMTLATSTGLPFLALAFHVVAGTAGLVAGWLAIAARKGGPLHRRSGLVFVAAMNAMGLAAVGISVFEGKKDVASGAFAAYLIFTGWIAIRPLPDTGKRLSIALLALPGLFAAGGFARGLEALDRPGRQLEGVPAGMLFFLATIAALAAIGDIRMMRAGDLHGSRRLARHLWRMCFGLFIASGSFVAQLVRMTFMPAWMRSISAILVMSATPLVVLLYWMWRVRLKQNLRGLTTGGAARAGVTV
jgi:uncharacterized membrane protein